jgi:hypothetical protein
MSLVMMLAVVGQRGAMAFVPPRVKLLFQRHMKALGISVPLAAVSIVEVRDLYERGQWEGASGLDSYRTGDVVLLSHRWYALPTWSEKIYSLTTKLLMKSAWDDVGIIINTSGKPHILRSGYHGVQYMELADFLGEMKPRGAAIRELSSLQSSSMKVTDGHMDGFARSNLERRVTPWSVLWGAVEDASHTKHYRYAVQASELAWEVRKMMGDGSTREAIDAKRSKLHDSIVMEQELARHIRPEDERPHKRLFNASMVAEALQEMRLLPEPFPEAYRYGPQDFTWRLPLINANYGDPVIVFKS